MITFPSEFHRVHSLHSVQLWTASTPPHVYPCFKTSDRTGSYMITKFNELKQLEDFVVFGTKLVLRWFTLLVQLATRSDS